MKTCELSYYFSWPKILLIRVFVFTFQGKEKQADAVRLRFSEGSQSDHIMLINAFQVCLIRGSVLLYHVY